MKEREIYILCKNFECKQIFGIPPEEVLCVRICPYCGHSIDIKDGNKGLHSEEELCRQNEFDRRMQEVYTE